MAAWNSCKMQIETSDAYHCQGIFCQGAGISGGGRRDQYYIVCDISHSVESEIEKRRRKMLLLIPKDVIIEIIKKKEGVINVIGRKSSSCNGGNQRNWF